MAKNYIDVPNYTCINDIERKNYTLSATQYKSFNIKNKNIKPLSYFLSRKLKRDDLGTEVGSECYVGSSKYIFIRIIPIRYYKRIYSIYNPSELYFIRS